MDASGGLKRPIFTVWVILVISVIVDRSILALLFPWVPQLGGIGMMIVFLDIPLPLPTIDLIPVAGIFTILYLLQAIIYGALSGEPLLPAPGKRLRVILKGGIGLMFWVLAPAVLFYYVQNFLPREVRNGINSFGLDIDVYIPYPGLSVIHLQGSMLLLICFSIGLMRYARKVNGMMLPTPSRAVAAVEKETGRKRAGGRQRITMQIPEPVLAPAHKPMPVRKPQLRTESVPVVAPLPVIAPLPEMEPMTA